MCLEIGRRIMLTWTSDGSAGPNLSYAKRHDACKTSLVSIIMLLFATKVVAATHLAASQPLFHFQSEVSLADTDNN